MAMARGLRRTSPPTARAVTGHPHPAAWRDWRVAENGRHPRADEAKMLEEISGRSWVCSLDSSVARPKADGGHDAAASRPHETVTTEPEGNVRTR